MNLEPCEFVSTIAPKEKRKKCIRGTTNLQTGHILTTIAGQSFLQGCRSRPEPPFLARAGAAFLVRFRLRLLLLLYSAVNIYGTLSMTISMSDYKYDYDYKYGYGYDYVSARISERL